MIGLSLLIHLIYVCPFVFSQAGSDCRTDVDCYSHQTCHFGYCQCVLGYIKNIRHCFPIRQHGQDCEFVEQCQDFRMVCQTRENETFKRCLCDRFHVWHDELEQCVQVANLTAIVQSLQEEMKWAEDIERNAKKVFFGLVVAGLSVVSIGLICSAMCLVYGCCFRGKRYSDKSDDRQKLKVMEEVASTGSPTAGKFSVIPMDKATSSSIP